MKEINSLQEISQQHKQNYQLALSIINSNAIVVPTYTIQEQHHATKENASCNLLAGAVHTSIAKFEAIENRTTGEKNMGDLLYSILNTIRILTGESVCTPVDIENVREFTKSVSETQENTMIFRCGGYNDAKIYQQFQDFFQNLDITISQSHGWKDILEDDHHIAYVISLLQQGLLENELSEFLKYKKLTDTSVIQEILVTSKDLFPKSEIRHNLILEESKNENLILNLFVNSIIFGDFSKKMEDTTNYPETNSFHPKIIKISGTKFGKGVILLDEIDLFFLANQKDESTKIIETCNLIAKKISDKSGTLYSSEYIKDKILDGQIVIKEFISGIQSQTHCLNIIKNSLDSPNEWQYTLLTDTKEIKDENDVWIGSEIDTTNNFSILCDKLDSSPTIILMCIEILHYLAWVVKSKNNNNFYINPEKFNNQNLFLSGVDWCVANGKIKFIEFSGRMTGSTPIFFEMKAAKKDYDIEKALFIRNFEINSSIHDFTGDKKDQSVMSFVNFLKTGRIELDNKSLAEILTVHSIFSDEFGRLSLGFIVYNEYTERIDTIKSLLQQFPF